MATITIPAAYLKDARVAAIREVSEDAGAFANGDTIDLRSNVKILDRSVRLHDELLAATGDVTVTAESDNTSSPITHLLEEMIRVLAERLDDAKGYAPVPMRDVLDIAEELRWAATEAIRLHPTEADWRMAA